MERSVVEYTKATGINQKRPGGLRSLFRFSGKDLHAADQPILNEVDVFHHLIEEEQSVEVVNDLVDEDGGLIASPDWKLTGSTRGLIMPHCRVQ